MDIKHWQILERVGWECFKGVLIRSYRIAGKFGEEFNLAFGRIDRPTEY